MYSSIFSNDDFLFDFNSHTIQDEERESDLAISWQNSGFAIPNAFSFFSGEMTFLTGNGAYLNALYQQEQVKIHIEDIAGNRPAELPDTLQEMLEELTQMEESASSTTIAEDAQAPVNETKPVISPPPVSHGGSAPKNETDVGERIIIKLADGVEDVEGALNELLGEGNYEISFVAKALTGLVMVNIEGGLAGIAMESIQQSDLVDAMEEDRPVTLNSGETLSGSEGQDTLEGNGAEIDSTPNDPYYGQQWNLDTINAPEAWEITQGSEDIVVAVLDTGIDFNHQDLDDNIWYNEDEIAGNGIDDDGNGYVDDWRGWDFNDHDNNPTDDHGHGTMVAGIIAAEANNGIGITGIAPNVKIMALDIFNSTPVAYQSSILEALDYAVANGASVSNNSYGSLGLAIHR